MNTQHTPGPWNISPPCELSPRYSVYHNGPLVYVERGEDARLIAAAPEMLDLLYTVLPYIEDLELDQMYKPGVVAALTRRIRDTLDKAEGVQP